MILWEQPPQTRTDLLLLPLTRTQRKATPFLTGPFAEDNPDISPDGRWVAYHLDESGDAEIYVRPFPDVSSGRWQISNGGGSRPVWSHQGGELFFLDRAGVLMSVTVHTSNGFSADVPTRLHSVAYYPGPAGRGFDVSQDDQRFLMIKDGADEGGQNVQLVLVQNWVEELTWLAPSTGR